MSAAALRTSVKPAIPEDLADLPTWKGLVIPYVQVVLRDGTPDFRAVHETKRVQALESRLCSICGRPLGYRIVFLAHSAHQVESRIYVEPPMHPVCADYAIAACAMIAGRMAEYPVRPHKAHGADCSDPDCDCDGWVSHGPQRAHAARRSPWWRVETRGYSLTHGRRLELAARADRALETREIG